MIDLGGDLTALNGVGITPLGTANLLGSADARDVLLAAGAK